MVVGTRPRRRGGGCSHGNGPRPLFMPTLPLLAFGLGLLLLLRRPMVAAVEGAAVLPGTRSVWTGLAFVGAGIGRHRLVPAARPRIRHGMSPQMAAAPPTTPTPPSPAAATPSPAAPSPLASTAAPPKSWVLTVAPPASGPREAVLLRRLKALDPLIVAVEVQEFYFLQTGDEALAAGVVGVLQEAGTAAAAGGGAMADDQESSGSHNGENRHHWRAYAPRPAFRSVWSSNVRSILAARGVLGGPDGGEEQGEDPTRLLALEAGRWYRISSTASSTQSLSPAVEALLHDRMTECAFPLLAPEAWGSVGATSLPSHLLPPGLTAGRKPSRGTTMLPLRARGPVVLEEASAKFGLGLGPWEVEFIKDLFLSPAFGIERDPTAVEIFDVAQSLSEHCRHWTFDGQFVVDKEEREASLMEMVRAPLRRLQEAKDGDDNSLLAFEDNSSAIRGRTPVLDLQPLRPDGPSPYVRVEGIRHPILTAETHNFPCSIAPFPGAQTGVGGRIRDILATGRGAKTLAGLAGYAVGDICPSLHASDCSRSSRSSSSRRPQHVADPLDVLLRASDGASDYANKYGEPLLGGFARAMAPWPDADGAEFLKPIMFSAGIGVLPDAAVRKRAARPGMAVVKVGGPAYRVGLGGGAASSKVGGEPELDLQAVQRGDPEMGNRVGRVIRACVEVGEGEGVGPLLASVHDQGAGGNANVLKELVAPEGADVYLGRVRRGDASLSPLEVWGAEYQESQGVLVEGTEALAVLRAVCAREAAPMEVVGTVTGHGRIRVFEGQGEEEGEGEAPLVDLPLQPLLSHRPRRVIAATAVVPPPWAATATAAPRTRSSTTTAPSSSSSYTPSSLHADLLLVLGTVAVGSKAFLTNKVDRSVSGLVAAQPCVGPLHLPVGDVGVAALSFWGRDGVATALGECPGVGLLDVEAMVRLALGEALTNLAAAPLSRWADVKLQANWMWPGREGPAAAALYRAVEALRDVLLDLGLALDGGKDSLSMATDCGVDKGGRVPSPPTVVLTAYAPCVDVGGALTPDVKLPWEEGGEGVLLHVDVGGRGAGRPQRLGGSALAEVVGDEEEGFAVPPDLDDPALLRRAFEALQALQREGRVAALHDVSAGGVVATVLEMAMAGDAGARLVVPSSSSSSSSSSPKAARAWLFAEELGWVLEVRRRDVAAVQAAFAQAAVPCAVVGASTRRREFVVAMAGGEKEEVLLREDVAVLRAAWEATSLKLERLQANPACVAAEERSLPHQRRPRWRVPFRLLPSIPSRTSPFSSSAAVRRPRVGILREQGSNGDREMAAAFTSAGFEAWDLTVHDLLQGAVSLEGMDGLAFVGGFSYGDALGSARGWTSVLKGNPRVRAELSRFFARPDSWTLGLCNGCQLLAALGIVPGLSGEEGEEGPPSVALAENESGRFESRFVTVGVEAGSPAVLLQGMEEAVLGVWSAHGEGRFVFREAEAHAGVLARRLAPLRYVDPVNHGPTEGYPHNPNGSPQGIAALCSPCGRHLAIMPHPERSWLAWQMPWMPPGAATAAAGGDTMDEGGEKGLQYSPWFRLFQNAYAFSMAQHEKQAAL